MQTYPIEQCLEIMAGLQSGPVVKSFVILERDKKILVDIAKKVYKGSALTDKQYEVVKRILVNRYASQFKLRDIDIQNSANILRKPIRHLDRTKYIRIEDGGDYQDGVWGGFTPLKIIVIRFPFNLMLSKLVSDIKKLFPHKVGRFYSQRIKDKYLLPFDERIIHKLVGRFKGRIKDIDPILLKIYDEVEHILNNPDDYVPGINNYEIKHSSKEVTKHHLNKFGKPNADNLFLFYDRKIKLGLKHFDTFEVEKSKSNLSVLTKKILDRKYPMINIDLKKWQLNHLTECIDQLQRYPLLVIVSMQDKRALEQLQQFHSQFKNLVDPKDISVLVRLPNKGTGAEFNTYVKDNGINNSLANTTKIVYINSKKIPKPLVQSTWRPESVICCDGSKNYTKVDTFLYESDLVFNINGQTSMFLNFYDTAETI